MLFFGGILVGSTRTPPEKPLYCCRKGCCSQFRTGDSRMRFLKDSRMLIHYQICSSLQNKPPKKTIAGNCYPILHSPSEEMREKMSSMAGHDLNQYILGLLQKLDSLVPDSAFSELPEVSWTSCMGECQY